MKSPTQTKKIVKIFHVALNSYSQEIGDYILKLAYHFNPIDNPRIEVFANTKEAQAESWPTYGAPEEFILLEHTFTTPGESVVVPPQVISPAVQITWLSHDKETYDYAKSTESVIAYNFEITITEK